MLMLHSQLLTTVAMPTRHSWGARLAPGLCYYPWPHQSYPEMKGPHFQVTQTHPSFLRKTCDQIKPSNYLARINKLASARMQAIPLLTPRRKRRHHVCCLHPVLSRDTSSPGWEDKRGLLACVQGWELLSPRSCPCWRLGESNPSWDQHRHSISPSFHPPLCR